MNVDRGLHIKLNVLVTAQMRDELEREAQERLIPVSQVVRDRCFPPKRRDSQAK